MNNYKTVTKPVCEKFTKMRGSVRLTFMKKRAIITSLPQECDSDSFAVRTMYYCESRIDI